MNNETSHGGKRPGAGRKTAYGEPTRQLRIPQSQVPIVLHYLSTLRQTRQVAPSRNDNSIGAIQQLGIETVQRWAIPAMSHTVPAGFPSPADDYIQDRIDLNEHLITHREATFILRVSGWSMINAGIHDGDEIIVDRALNAAHGNIVVAVIDNALTVKRLYKTDTAIRLVPENPEFQDIIIGTDEELIIWGVVTRVLHKV